LRRAISGLHGVCRKRVAVRGVILEELLRVEDLKTYFYTITGVVRAVDNVSFSLNRGEVLGLAGESGCGKTNYR